jgi:hypothetical protein
MFTIAHRAPLRRRSSSLFVAAVGALFLLAGCNNSPYPTGDTARAVSYRALAGELKTMDPAIAYTVSEAAVIDVIYPSYYQYHYLKQVPSYQLELALGASEPKREPYTARVEEPVTDARASGEEKRQAAYATVTKQGEQYTFHDQKGLRFQDDPCFPAARGAKLSRATFCTPFAAWGCPIARSARSSPTRSSALTSTSSAPRSCSKKPATWT